MPVFLVSISFTIRHEHDKLTFRIGAVCKLTVSKFAATSEALKFRTTGNTNFEI